MLLILTVLPWTEVTFTCLHPYRLPLENFFGEPVVEEFKKNVQVMRCFLS